MPLGALVSLFILGGIEISLHVLSKHLPEPVLWGTGEPSSKIAIAGRVAEQSVGLYTILIQGPSHASVGIDPNVLKLAFEEQSVFAFNAGLNGRTYRVIDFCSQHVFEDLFKPDLVVLTASPVIFNENNLWMERNTSEFMSSPMPKHLAARGINRAWLGFLSKDLELYRLRKREFGLSRGWVDGKLKYDDRGFRPLEGTYTEVERQKFFSADHPYQKILRSIKGGGPSLVAFDRMVTRLNEKKIDVVVVNMPFRSDLLQVTPGLKDDYQVYLKQMEERAQTLGFLWLDYADLDLFTDQEFRDVDHLNKNGASKVTLQLAEDIRNYVVD